MMRVLHVIGAMGAGGAETMIMNLYRNIDRNQVQFDFVVHTKQKQFYDNEIESLGGRIFHVDIGRFNVLNTLAYKKYWELFFKEHMDYPIVHAHINSSALIYLSTAKKSGIFTVIHSHATKGQEPGLRKYVFRAFSYPNRFIADYFFACSRQAGIDRFGQTVVNNPKIFRVLKNGIDTERYCFSKAVREQLREEQGISDGTLVIGHVGRFSEVKNHSFLIEVFAKVHKSIQNTKLLLVGDGELRKSVIQQVKALGLENSVIFAGTTSHVEEYLMGMDLFVFPSLYEGLGISLIEAQATGLPCVVADTIQQEAIVTPDVTSLPLESGPEDWAKRIVLTLESSDKVNRIDATKQVANKGYDIRLVAKELQKFYLSHE